MKRLKLLLFLPFFCSTLLGAQTRIGWLQNDLKTSPSFINDVIPFVNSDTGELIIFIAAPKKVYTYKLDKDFKPVNKITSENKKRKYKTLIGGSVKGTVYSLFLSNKNQKKFAFINFSFKNKTSTFKEFLLEKNDQFIQSFKYKGQFFMLAINTNSKSVLLYEYNAEDQVMVRNEIDTKNQMLMNEYNEMKSIADMINSQEHTIKKFEKDTPNSIETASDLIKMYIRDHQIVLSFDENRKGTQVIFIDIDNKSITKKVFDKPLKNVKSIGKRSNSFIYDDKIALVAGNSKIFSMHILDFQSGKFIKEYAVNKDEKITFKNTPIIQNGGAYKSYREFEKTSKFLRKISAQNIGVSIIKNQGNYQFTIGGYSKQASGGAPMPMMGMGGVGGMAMGGIGGIPIASSGGITFFFNPTMFSYNSFAGTKSTEIQCLFDDNFEHIKDVEAPENVFDKIEKHEMKNTSHETIFRYKDFFIKGAYNTSRKVYYLTKFTK